MILCRPRSERRLGERLLLCRESPRVAEHPILADAATARYPALIRIGILIDAVLRAPDLLDARVYGSVRAHASDGLATGGQRG